MIVSASRRTDLPAFHSKWLTERIEAGWVEAANPFNPAQVRRIDLTPAPAGTMEALALWTRNPAPLLSEVEKWEARGLRTLWLVTVTGYPKALEANAPDTGEVAATLTRLAKAIGRERIFWRYDPVFASDALGMDAAWHASNFERLAAQLGGSVSGVILSVYDDYSAARRRLKAAAIDFNPVEARLAVAEVARIALAAGLPAQSCCEELSAFGVMPRGCIDRETLKGLWGIDGLRRDSNQRKECLCAEAADIGVYSTCSHGCLYCYATRKAVQ